MYNNFLLNYLFNTGLAFDYESGSDLFWCEQNGKIMVVDVQEDAFTTLATISDNARPSQIVIIPQGSVRSNRIMIQYSFSFNVRKKRDFFAKLIAVNI